MDTKYHINMVTNPTTGYTRTSNDHALVKKAISLYDVVEKAMQQVIKDGDYEAYVKSITEYDKFVWIESHKGDKANLFSYKKIKVSPTWTEQLWAVVFERVRLALEKNWASKLEIIQNKSVVESVGTKGPNAYKDVDNGVGILKTYDSCIAIHPIVVAEMKTGHFCKTACNGVDSIVGRVRKMNANVLAFCITDNNISVGTNVEVEHVWGSGGILIQQRGIGANNNKSKNYYPKLEAGQFKLVEELCLNYLLGKKPKDFLDIKANKTSGVYLRERIEQNGYYLPPSLEKYIKETNGERLSTLQ